jgi:hypothetical protein
MGGAQDKIIGWYEAYIYILVLATYWVLTQLSITNLFNIKWLSI